MPPSTGYTDQFDLIAIDNGFVIIHPTPKSPNRIPEYKHFPKLSYTFNEYKEWLKILEVSTVGELNELISKGPNDVIELIRVSEALHEKKYAQIADDIIKRKNVKLILIAGPSSSGKTTSAKRLSLQLKVNGLKPIPISLDDYFVDREKTPKDENGNYDFESIHALNLDLFNMHLTKLLNGEEVELPKFDFVHGKSLPSGKKIKLEPGQILIVEGIHGLNETLTASIPRDYKYKIYVSALTQMNLDSMNRITTTDTRLIRRIVRDFKFRGHNALATLKMWPSVRRGEERNIFPYQEEADVMFNSNLIYELSVLKIFAEPLLLSVDNCHSEYSEAKRLLKFLDYFLPITELEEIPRTSIIREFIGRSTFKY
nr:nucleoside kinase [Marinitoga litoralis]